MTLTYNSLLADVPVVLMAQSRDIDALVALAIKQAHDEIVERLDHDAFQVTMAPVFIVSAANSVIDLSEAEPMVFEVRSLRADVDGIPCLVERRDIERLVATFSADDSGPPRYYAEDGSPLRLQVFPIPDQTYQIKVTANVMPDRLAPERQTTLLSARYPRLIENAVYRHTAKLMRNPADEQRYAREFDMALTGANTQIARRRRDEVGTTSATPANLVG